MLDGLRRMSPQELAEIGKLIGVEKPGVEQVLAWVGKQVGCSDSNPERIERAALEWMARDHELGIVADTNELEKSVRVGIANEAAEFLTPSWHLACALAALGPGDAIEPKLRLLERAASLAVPSASRREKLVKEWDSMCRGDQANDLKTTVERLRQEPHKIDHALTLAMVICLADGRLAVDEEKQFRELAEKLGRTQDDVNELMRRVNNRFWNHQTDSAPKNTANVDPDAERDAALKAAELTLGSAGTLEGLVLEARDKVLAGKEAPPPPEPAKKSGWQRFFGSLTGVTQYLSSRSRTPEQVALARIVYLSILRQHSAVERQKAEAAPPPATAPVAEAASPPRVDETTTVSAPPPRRSIKL